MRQIALIVIVAISTGIAAAQDDQRLVVVARLTEFLENAEWTDFVDGSFWTHHLSRFVIIAPSDLCGKELHVFHASIPDSDTPWRQIGKTFEIALSEERAAALLGQEPPGQSRAFYGTSWTEVLREVRSDDSDCASEAP